MASSSPKECQQHPSTTYPSNNKEHDPPLATKPPPSLASTKRSQSEPGFKTHTGTGAAAANNKDNLHSATAARLANNHPEQHGGDGGHGHHGHSLHPTHARPDRGSSGGGSGGNVTPGSQASSQACESAEVSESDRGVMRRERTDVVHQGPGGEY